MIPLAVPNLTGNEKNYLEHCIDTTYVSSVGEYVSKLEQMTANATGSDFAVATSAGTTGLHAALTAVGVNPGDLVILPTFTFIASANAAAHCKAIPWLMDIDDTWCMDAGIVKEEIEKHCERKDGNLIHIDTGRRVAAIMPVYTLGNIPDMDQFRSIADDYDIPLVADAACAVGAKYKNSAFGSLADVSVLSFNGNKTITCGGGGMAVGNDERLLSHIRHLTTTSRVGVEYDFDMIGFNYRMTNIQAAVGCAQMERLHEFIAAKHRIRLFYEKQFKDLKSIGISLFPMTEGSSCWFSGIVLPAASKLEDTRQIIQKLKERGIESRTFWKPVHLQEPYLSAPRSSVEKAESVWERIITLPCSTNITENELQFVAESLMEIVTVNLITPVYNF